MEHLTGTLAIAAGDQRGVGVDKAALVKELVNGKGAGRPHTKHRAEGVGAGTQVGDGAQIFQRMTLFLQGIIGGGGPLHLHCGGVDLTRLLRLRGEQQGAGDTQSRAHILTAQLLKIAQILFLGHDLQIAQAAAVVELHKAQALGFAQGAHPATDRHGLPAERLCVRIQRRDLCSVHQWFLPF